MKRLVALFVILAAGAVQPLFAASDTRFKIFGAAVWVAPLSEDDFDTGTIDDTLEAADSVGWNFGFEFQFSDRLGIEVDYINSTQDIEFGGDTVAEVDFQPLSASLNIHLFDSDIFDLYIAPTASWVNWGDVESDDVTFETSTDSEFAWGAQIGLDIGLGDRVAIVTGLRYLNLDLSGDGGGELGVDPLIARAGIGIRF